MYLWLQEFCDAGSLRQAVIRQHMWDKHLQCPDLRAVLDCALEFASGLAHLHRHNIIHGDVSTLHASPPLRHMYTM